MSHTKNLSETGDKKNSERGDPLVVLLFSKSSYIDSDQVWWTEMEGQTSLTVEVGQGVLRSIWSGRLECFFVDPKGAKISKKGNNIICTL